MTNEYMHRLVQSLPHPVAAFLRRRKRSFVQKRFAPRVVEHTYAGVPLKVEIADPTAAGWYDGDWHSQMPEVALLRTGQLGPGSRIFNVGAHQCVVALALLHHAAPDGEILAVEAGRHNVEIARHNLDLNGRPAGLTILHAAGSDRTGRMVFDELAGNVPTDPRKANDPATVPAVTLDSLAVEYGWPDVLYVDVEGAEGAVLRGAPKVLSQHPDCFIEVHVGVGLEQLGSSASEVVGFFSQADYQLFVGSQGSEDFAEYQSGEPLPESRFFLICLARGS